MPQDIKLTTEEITFLCNAINESLELVNESEFHARTGMTKEKAKVLHQKLSSYLN